MLQQLYQVLSSDLEEGKSAVKMVNDSKGNPEIRIEYNFEPYNRNLLALNHKFMLIQTFVKLGLLDQNYEQSELSNLPYIALKAENAPALRNPNFKKLFQETYQNERLNYQVEKLHSILQHTIDGGEKAVTIHPGSTSNPGLQLRIEYDFPPYNQRGKFYNIANLDAARLALVQIGLIDQNEGFQSHGDSPFIIIQPKSNNFTSTLVAAGQFSKAFSNQIKEKLIKEMQPSVKRMEASLSALQDPSQSGQNRLQQEKVFNQAIREIITLAQSGLPQKSLPKIRNWMDENKEKVMSWINSDYVDFELKQFLQKQINSEQYYKREYKANDPLISLVIGKLQEEEKQWLNERSTAGGHNISLEIDKILKALEMLDLADKLPHENAKDISKLLNSALQVKNDAVTAIITKIQQSENYKKATEPNTITMVTLKTLTSHVQREINYLAVRGHNSQKQKYAAERLNNAINQIMSISKEGGENMLPSPNWFKENNSIVEEWLKNDYVSHETRQKLQKIVKPDAYYERNYTPRDPFIKTVWTELINLEKKERHFNPHGNFYVMSEIDNLLKSLEKIDRGSSSPPKIASEADTLLRTYETKSDDLFDLSAFERVVNSLLRNAVYQERLSIQKQMPMTEPPLAPAPESRTKHGAHRKAVYQEPLSIQKQMPMTEPPLAPAPELRTKLGAHRNVTLPESSRRQYTPAQKKQLTQAHGNAQAGETDKKEKKETSEQTHSKTPPRAN